MVLQALNTISVVQSIALLAIVARFVITTCPRMHVQACVEASSESALQQARITKQS